jgi:hypothetical protein
LKSTRLIFWSAVAYGILLVLARGIFPSEATPTLSLVGIPLIVIAVIIARDLAQRSTRPSSNPSVVPGSALKEDPVKFLAGQLGIAADASDSYFENVVRSRLKELLISKVSLEIGLDSGTVRRNMSDPRKGPQMLHDDQLYRILYGRTPKTRDALAQMIEDAIDMIGAWKE